MTEISRGDVSIGRRDVDIARLRRLAQLLDTAVRVPGTRFGLGLDAVIGLIPGIGDALGAALSGYIVMQAARLGASRATLARMLLNIGVDTLIGVIPAVGDIFDFGWKANTRNLALLNAHLERPTAVRASSRRVMFAIGLVVVLILAGLVALATIILRAVAQHL